MASITSTGVGSGLDVSTIVSSLMTIERRPLQALQTQASTIQTKLSAFGTLQSQLASLGDVATRLASTAKWNPLRVDSSNSAAVSATSSRAAATSVRRAMEVVGMGSLLSIAEVVRSPRGSFARA